MRDLADAWQALADLVGETLGEADPAVMKILQSWGGGAGEAFGGLWNMIGVDPNTGLPLIQEIAGAYAVGCDQAALEIEYAKLTVLIAVIITVIAVFVALLMAWLGGVSAGAIPGILAAGRQAVTVAFRRLIAQMGRQLLTRAGMQAALRAAGTRVGQIVTSQGFRQGLNRLGLELLEEIGEELIIDVGAQAYQMHTGQRRQWDGNRTFTAGVGGAYGAVLGSGMNWAGRRAAPRMPFSFSPSQLSFRGSGLVRWGSTSLTSGMQNAIISPAASVLANGSVNGQWAMPGADAFLGGFASGAGRTGATIAGGASGDLGARVTNWGLGKMGIETPGAGLGAGGIDLSLGVGGTNGLGNLGGATGAPGATGAGSTGGGSTSGGGSTGGSTSVGGTGAGSGSTGAGSTNGTGDTSSSGNTSTGGATQNGAGTVPESGSGSISLAPPTVDATSVPTADGSAAPTVDGGVGTDSPSQVAPGTDSRGVDRPTSGSTEQTGGGQLAGPRPDATTTTPGDGSAGPGRTLADTPSTDFASTARVGVQADSLASDTPPAVLPGAPGTAPMAGPTPGNVTPTGPTASNPGAMAGPQPAGPQTGPPVAANPNPPTPTTTGTPTAGTNAPPGTGTQPGNTTGQPAPGRTSPAGPVVNPAAANSAGSISLTPAAGATTGPAQPSTTQQGTPAQQAQGTPAQQGTTSQPGSPSSPGRSEARTPVDPTAPTVPAETMGADPTTSAPDTGPAAQDGDVDPATDRSQQTRTEGPVVVPVPGSTGNIHS
ncbi:hypothetical protein AB0M52_32380, partial [Micromonospora sp. NPDC051296]